GPAPGAAADRAGPVPRLKAIDCSVTAVLGVQKGGYGAADAVLATRSWLRGVGYAETSSCQSATRGRLCASETERCATLPPAMFRPAARAASRSNAALTPRFA